jgi:DNA-binding transcriptional ArsR family regulator
VPDLSHKQQEALKDETRMAILTFLQGYDQPASLGEIDEGIGKDDPAKTHYHLDVLVEVELVEKVFGTTRYRVVAA